MLSTALARRHSTFAIGTAVLLALHYAVLADVTRLSTHDSTASHLVLVPFVTLGLIAMRRGPIFGAARTISRAGAIVAIVAAIVVGVLCRAWGSASPVDADSAAMTALVAYWLALFLVVYGPASFRAALFPLLFVAFSIPIPQDALSFATLYLRKGSADVVADLLTLVGMPFHRAGFAFALPKFTIEIAEACSGIRSSIALLLTALLASHMCLQTGWKKILLVALVVPLAIVKNGIRIVTLSLLGTYVDVGYIDGPLHHEGGIVFFMVALVLLFLPILIVLQRTEPPANLEARWG